MRTNGNDLFKKLYAAVGLRGEQAEPMHTNHSRINFTTSVLLDVTGQSWEKQCVSAPICTWLT
jgi:hypothetical protein